MEIDDYIELHCDSEPEWLARLDRDTRTSLLNGRMCSGRVQGRLLKMLARMIRPMRALELGTFSGYSAFSLAEGMPEGSVLHTLEADDELQDFIREHLASVPDEVKDRIRFHFGDALSLLPGLGDGFDLVFIDADKRQYCEYYEAVLPLVRQGGYIIADNTLWDGHVIESTRHAPQTAAIMRFNDMVASDDRVEKVMVPVRDGLTLIRKKTPEEIRNQSHG